MIAVVSGVALSLLPTFVGSDLAESQQFHTAKPQEKTGPKSNLARVLWGVYLIHTKRLNYSESIELLQQYTNVPLTIEGQSYDYVKIKGCPIVPVFDKEGNFVRVRHTPWLKNVKAVPPQKHLLLQDRWVGYSLAFQPGSRQPAHPCLLPNRVRRLCVEFGEDIVGFHDGLFAFLFFADVGPHPSGTGLVVHLGYPQPDDKTTLPATLFCQDFRIVLINRDMMVVWPLLVQKKGELGFTILVRDPSLPSFFDQP